MNTRIHRRLALVLSLFLPATPSAFAQADNQATPLSALKAPAQAMAGAPISIVVESGNYASRWCGLVLDFGDGEVRQIKIGYDVQFPITVSKSYDKPGSYAIKAFGRRITTHTPCDGTLNAQVTVAGTPAAAAAPRPATPVATNCPATINVRNAAGAEVAFGLRQLVVDSGGIQKAREQVAQRLLDTQSRALDDALPAPERENAKQFAGSLRIVREALSKCE